MRVPRFLWAGYKGVGMAAMLRGLVPGFLTES